MNQSVKLDYFIVKYEGASNPVSKLFWRVCKFVQEFRAGVR